MARSVPADVWILGALLALTATFGKGFSTIGIPGTDVFVTEPALALAGGIALMRLGPAGFVAEIRTRVPLIPLAVFWLAAAVAIFQGIHSYGVAAMIEDVGLGEYSLVIPLVAVVGCSLVRADLLTRFLVAGLMGATFVYAISDLSVRLLGTEGTFFDVQEITYGLYMSMLVGYVAARLADREPAPRHLVAFGGLALVLIFLTNARGVWISVLIALAVVTLLNSPGERLRFGAGAAAAVLCAVTLAIGIQFLGGASQITTEVRGAVRGVEEPTAGGGSAGASSEESDNARWRIAFWEEIVDRSVENPVFGVGYGEPIAFTWEGLKYDFRDGDPDAVIDVDGPHNEFLHILYRMGYVGLGSLLALIGVALVRVWRVVRRARLGVLEPGTRSLLVGLTAMWFASATVSFFADALKAPFLGLFFWSSLGLLLAVASLAKGSKRPGTPAAPSASG